MLENTVAGSCCSWLLLRSSELRPTNRVRETSVRSRKLGRCVCQISQLVYQDDLSPHQASSITSQLLSRQAGVGDTLVTLISKVLHRRYHVLENMLCRPYTFHHTTHTSPHRRQIGKHICRQRFDAHSGQPQTTRLCRARAISRE